MSCFQVNGARPPPPNLRVSVDSFRNSENSNGMSFQCPVSPLSSNDPLSPSSATSRRSRRSLIMMANQYFSRSRHSPTQSSLKDWNAHDLNSVIKRTNRQVVSLGSPASPLSPVVRDLRNKPALVCVGKETRYEPRYGQKFELHYEPEPFVFDYFLEPPGQPSPRPSIYSLPPPQYTPRSPPPPPPQGMPQPDRRPTSPPPLVLPLVAELPAMEPEQSRIRRAPSAKKVKPAIGLRRTKTPVRRIGQLEAAAKRRQGAAIGRQPSVRTIARQTRVLVDETLVPEVPPVPVVHRKALPLTALPDLHKFGNYHSTKPHQPPSEPQGLGLLKEPEPRNEATPSLASDTDTLVSFHDDSLYVKPLDLSSPFTLPFEQDYYVDDDYIKSPDTDALQSQIGLDMLTRELSTTLADGSSRADRDASGLQIWVMIEAYERLRDKISAMEKSDPELEKASAAFDSWVDALRVIQRSIADEAAESESDYEDED